MQNMQKLYVNAEFGAVRTLESDGTILFCAADVARALGYKRPADAIATHCKTAKNCKLLTNGGTQTVKFISEGDVYRLIVQSDLPSADQFEAWIFEEVLPSIRRTGMYATDMLLSDPDLALQAFRALQEERERRLAAEQHIEALQPKVQYADAVSASKSTILIGDLAKILKQNGIEIGQQRLFAYLRQNGYLMQQGSRKNMPTQRSMELGLFEINQTAITSPHGTRLNRTPKVTGKGQQYFIRHFLQMVA